MFFRKVFAANPASFVRPSPMTYAPPWKWSTTFPVAEAEEGTLGYHVPPMVWGLISLSLATTPRYLLDMPGRMVTNLSPSSPGVRTVGVLISTTDM